MKRSKRAFSMLLTLIILICTFYTAPKAEAADVQKMTNLIVCVRFSENADENVFAKTADDMVAMYNDTSGMMAGISEDVSFSAYLKAISRGKLSVKNVFPQYKDGTIIPFTLSGTLESSDDSSVLQEVIGAFNSGAIPLPDGIKYDNIYSGTIDNLTVILQGRSGLNSDSMMWPHKSVSAVMTKIKNRLYVGDYNFINSHSVVTLQSFGTLSHEFLHTVGFPDLYRLSGEGNPVSYWDIMASAGYYQQFPLSYLRYTKGWVPMNEITQSGDYTLDAVTSDSDRILFKIQTPMSDSEFFVLEYRKKVTDKLANVGFETKIPSSGLLIYRVNLGISDLTNIGGKDYIYVFRPGDTSATASAGSITDAAIDPSAGETSYGSADMKKGVGDNTIFYSDGTNSGIAVSNVKYSEDLSKISFHVDLPNYSSLGLWDGVGSLSVTNASTAQSAIDESGNIYVCTSRTADWNTQTEVYCYNGESWSLAAPALSGVYSAQIHVWKNELYMAYQNKNGYTCIAKLKNKAWSAVVTDNTAQYPNNAQLFSSGDKLYCAWAKDGTTLVIKEVSGSSFKAVDSSLTSSYFSNPCLAASGNYIYVLYSDFVFGNSSANYSKIKRYNISLSSWENVNTGQLVASSNLHKLVAADGEVYAVTGASGQTPLLIKVSENGSAEKREINTSIGNYISLDLDVSGSGTVCVGVFSAQGNAEVYYYDGGVQKQLGSSPCNASQSADLLVFGKSVYVTSVADTSGILAVRTKDLPQKAAPRLLARDGTNIEIKDGLVSGLPQKAEKLELYVSVTEGGYYEYEEIVTGARITVYTQSGEKAGEYYMVIFGDVNSDGVCDGEDSVIINAVTSGILLPDKIISFAADADRSGTVDSADVSAAVNSGLAA